jgi:DNA-binding CsgD family transcriptional regulator
LDLARCNIITKIGDCISAGSSKMSLARLSLASLMIDAATDTAALNELGRVLANQFGAHSHQIQVNFGNRPPDMLSRGFSDEAAAAYRNHFWKFDSLAAYSPASSGPFLAMSHELISDREIERDIIYREFGKPQLNAFYIMGAKFGSSGGESVTIGFHRSAKKGAFAADHKKQLASHAGLLQSCLKGHQRFRLLSRETALATAKPSNQLRIVADSAGQILSITGFGALYDRSKFAQRLIQVFAQRAVSRIEQATAAACANRIPHDEFVGLSVHGLELLFAVTRSPSAWWIDGTTPTSLILVKPLRAEGSSAEKIARIRKVFHLTPAEARVALALADGHAPKAYADAQGVSVETVRSQIKTIYQKMDVQRQAELVALVATILNK